MKKQRGLKKVFHGLLAGILLLSIFFTVDARASFNSPLPLPALTGNHLTDMMNVAKSQLGYSESQDGETYFADWAGGRPDDQWCSEFASWCAHAAGMPSSIVPVCTGGSDWYKFYGKLDALYILDGGVGMQGPAADYAKKADGSTRTLAVSQLKKGDIVLCETDNYTANGPDHTVIVSKVQDGVIYTIEGNMFGKVVEYTRNPAEVHAVCRPNYTIDAQNINKAADIKVYATEWNYAGKGIEPTITVKNPLVSLQEGVDYTVSYQNNVDAGTATITVNGIGAYTGTKTASFNIRPSDIQRPSLSASGKLTYTGEVLEKTITLTRDFGDGRKETLVENEDYTITNDKAVDAGTYRMVIEGIGNYEGIRYFDWTIAKASQASPVDLFTSGMVKFSNGTNKMKVGTTQSVVVEPGYKGSLLFESEDTNILTIDENGVITALSPGTTRIAVTADGGENYQYRTQHRTVEVHTGNDVYEVSGKPVPPTCDEQGYTLYVNQTDPTISYKADFVPALGHIQGSKVGTTAPGCETDGYEIYTCTRCQKDYKVVLPAVGHVGAEAVQEHVIPATYDQRGSFDEVVYCSGCGIEMSRTIRSINFLEKTALSNCRISIPQSSYVFNGFPINPPVTVFYPDGREVDPNEYYAQYSNCKLTGTATITVYPNVVDNCSIKGQCSTIFTIVPASIAGCRVELQNDNPVYNGSKKTPSIYLFDERGKRISHDYFDVTYSNNTAAGTATVTVTGKRFYTGTCTGTFTIERKDISGLSLKLEYSSVSYNGNARKPSVTVSGTNVGTLLKGTDYKVSYSNNINAGTASVKITGIGNFKGTVTRTFTIKKIAPTVTVPNKAIEKVYGNSAFDLGVMTNGDGKLTYTSSDTSIATVSSKGILTIRKVGTVKVRVCAQEGANYKASGTTTITVRIGPKAPKNVTAVNTANATIRLTWTDTVQRHSGYTVYRKGPGDKEYVKIGGTLGANQYTDKNVVVGKKYSYRVKAYYTNTIDGSAYSAYSGYNGTIVMYSLERPEQNDIVKDTDKGFLKVSWSAPKKATGYYVYRSTDGGVTFTKVKTTTNLYYKDTNVTKGKQYKYKVAAYFKTTDGKIYVSADSAIRSKTY